MRDRERKYKDEMATYHDERRHEKEIVLEVGDQVFRPQLLSHHSTQSLSQ